MLNDIHIENIVLIERLSLDFSGGFTALTGETGAGKSIILDSLSLVLGMRGETRLIGKAGDKASVTASFDIADNTEIKNILAEHDFDDLGDDLVVRRSLAVDGRSKAFINDRPVSVSLLKDIAPYLIEIHGQFDTQGLLDTKTHGNLLDRYAGLENDLVVMRDLYQTWRVAEHNYQNAMKQAEEGRMEEEYLRSSLDDLDTLNPQEGEEAELMTLREGLRNRESVLQAYQISFDALEGEKGASDSLIAALKSIQTMQDSTVEALVSKLDNALDIVREAGLTLEGLSNDLTHSDKSLEEVDDRLHALRGQARKHHCFVDDLPKLRDDIARKIALIENNDGALMQLQNAASAAHNAASDHAENIHDKRVKAAGKLDRNVMAELPPLKLEKALFATQLEKNCDALNTQGFTQTRFAVATNPGQEVGPMHKIASGGELARFMLAVKVALSAAQASSGPATLVFDEVDTGIGGAVSTAVGQRLASLATGKQVLVVTHAPQVAALANQHYKVQKSGAESLTTDVVVLSRAEAAEELARMLSGAEITDEARAAASKLIEQAA